MIMLPLRRYITAEMGEEGKARRIALDTCVMQAYTCVYISLSLFRLVISYSSFNETEHIKKSARLVTYVSFLLRWRDIGILCCFFWMIQMHCLVIIVIVILYGSVLSFRRKKYKSRRRVYTHFFTPFSSRSESRVVEMKSAGICVLVLYTFKKPAKTTFPI